MEIPEFKSIIATLVSSALDTIRTSVNDSEARIGVLFEKFEEELALISNDITRLRQHTQALVQSFETKIFRSATEQGQMIRRVAEAQLLSAQDTQKLADMLVRFHQQINIALITLTDASRHQAETNLHLSNGFTLIARQLEEILISKLSFLKRWKDIRSQRKQSIQDPKR